ncbi:MAG: alpha/beta hydrolase [Oligoflexia bacterium]|nr:alpha/beta hydrolase [Oligoflexia bacterium]
MQIQLPIKPRPRGARRKSIAEIERARDEDRSPVSHGYVKSFDGTKIFYSLEGKGPPLIFCYGLVCSSLHWTYQVDHFQKDYQAVWFDYRGHHNSETPKDLKSLTLENIAKDMGILLDELEIKEAVFLGHSMGVNTVLEFYRQQPHRVKAMVLANGTAKPPLETLFRNNAFQAGFKILKKLHEKSPELVQLFWKLQKGNPVTRSIISLGGFNPHLTPAEDIELYVDQVTEMDPSILIRLIENYDAYDATAWLHRVQVPTLILAGERDNVIPLEQQELMNQLIAGSQLSVVPHGSHCPQMDLPDLVNLRIEGFLRTLGYLPASLSSASAPSPTTESANPPTGKRPGPGRAKRV